MRLSGRRRLQRFPAEPSAEGPEGAILVFLLLASRSGWRARMSPLLPIQAAVESTRFGGHPSLWEAIGVHNASIPTPIPGSIPGADD